ncbi:MAG: type II toxin-antitoxin system death-on-curing family toxin [Candidatus Thorarchaeota archaeon]|nr:MAG: type II toxin-antitoxin system death-on-curing family toxin [Candidatus Thorarchaeota archaeon]
MILEFGGSYFEGNNNLLNPGSLDYLIDLILGFLPVPDQYPSPIHKSAILAWRIIKGHIFFDGNKRTGMEACRLLLEINGYQMKIDSQVIEMALDIANGEIEFPRFVKWLEGRTSKP